MATSRCNFKKEPEPSEIKMAENPLSNAMIITKIVSFLNVTNLRSCRLICKMWNRISMLALNVKTKFDISKLTQKQIDGCVMAIHKGLCFPPVNFMYSFEFHKKLCEKFMNFYGSRVKSLETADWKDGDQEVASTERYYLSSMLLIPLYLRSLTMKMLPRSIASAKSVFPRPLPRYPPLIYLKKLNLLGCSSISFGFLLDLLFAMPNLVEFCVSYPSEIFLTTLMKVFNTHQFRHLNVLEINPSMNVTTCHLLQLCRSGLQLKSLRLKFCYCRTDIGPLQELLQKFQSSLEELHLPDCLGESERTELNKYLQFPCMVVLKKLFIEDWSLVGPISFVKNTPFLETLAFDLPSDIFFPIKLSEYEDHLHLNLHELILPSSALSSDEIKHVLLVFPRLEKLSLQLIEAAAPALWEYGTNLKYLSLYAYSALTDSCLTGLTITNETFFTIHAAMLSENLKSVSHLRNATFIGKLQNLEVLKIDHPQGHISDISVIFGVGTLSKLRNFSLRAAQITDLSIKALETLPLLNLELVWNVGDPIFVSQESLQILQFKCPYLHLHYYPSENWKYISAELGTKLFSNPWFYAPAEN